MPTFVDPTVYCYVHDVLHIFKFHEVANVARLNDIITTVQYILREYICSVRIKIYGTTDTLLNVAF